MRVFLDTNVLVSAVATRGLCADVARSVLEFHELVVSEPLWDEVARVLKEKLRAPAPLIKEFLWLLQQDIIRAPVEPLFKIPLHDAGDIRILSSAIHGQAELFVTGDKELLALQSVEGLEIVSPRQFWERIKGSSEEN